MNRHPVRISAASLAPIHSVALTGFDRAQPLMPRTCDIWLLTASFLAPFQRELSTFLSQEEQARRDRFIRTEDRERYALFHGALRRILGDYTGKDPASLQFAVNPNGKPSLAGDVPTFNISHSGDWVAIACALSGEVGVDIEELNREIDALAIAKHSFHPHEIERLTRQPPAEQSPLFFAWWTAKEATLKAWGDTLFSTLGALDFSEWASGSSARLHAADGSAWNSWRFSDAHMVGTVVATGETRHITMRRGLTATRPQ